MSDTLHVKPREGLVVRDPESGKALPAAGGRVPNNSYWRRRRAAGDVLPVESKTARKSTKSEG